MAELKNMQEGIFFTHNRTTTLNSLVNRAYPKGSSAKL